MVGGSLGSRLLRGVGGTRGQFRARGIREKRKRKKRVNPALVKSARMHACQVTLVVSDSL